MRTVERAAELGRFIGGALGSSEWLTIDQPMIDRFAEATGDRQWIHIDAERAARELPGGRTIAHGYLTLSLLPRLSAQTWAVRARSRMINYGLDRLRFVAPVPAGSRVRLHSVLRGVAPAPGGTRVAIEATVEIEGEGRPALVAGTITLVVD